MIRVLTSLLLAGALVTATAAAPVKRNNSAPNTPSSHKKASNSKRASNPRPYQLGRASWYGKSFHGRSTASGEPYDMFQFTAAHPSLPLGSLVKVTNLRNQRSVVVRINDRGPLVPGRIIDLSYGAAQMLQVVGRGVERVRLDLVNADEVTIAENSAVNIPE